MEGARQWIWQTRQFQFHEFGEEPSFDRVDKKMADLDKASEEESAKLFENHDGKSIKIVPQERGVRISWQFYTFDVTVIYG